MSDLFTFVRPPQSTPAPVEEEDGDSPSLPFQIADLHNISNGGVSWTNPLSWGEKLQDMGRFIAVSGLSGINSFYNTGAYVGQFFDPGIQERDTADWITELDTDLGNYYRVNQESADVTGFILGAIVPGLGGIRVFNAGQIALKTAINTGKVGGTTGRALGLLVPKTDEFMSLAMKDITASTTTLNLVNANTTKAIGAGLWQNVMEAAAFETMVQATMFRSPILQQQDGWDIAQNIAIGGLLGGGVAGVFGAARLRGQLKTAIREEEVLRRPFQERVQFSVASPDANRLVQLSFDSEMAAVPITLRAADGTLIENNFAATKTLYEQKIQANALDQRTAWNNLSTDSQLGNTVANLMSPVIKDGRLVPGFAQQTYESASGAIKILRAGDQHPLELAQAKALAKGEAVENPIAIRFIKLQGDDSGGVFDSPGAYLSFADRYATPDKVRAAIRESFGFKQKFEATNRWSALKLKGAKAVEEAEARHIWAARSSGMLKEIPENAVIDRHDLPMLQRAYADGRTDIKIVSGEGPTVSIDPVTSLEELYKIIKQSKNETIEHFGRSFLTKKGKAKKGKEPGLIPKAQAQDGAIGIIADVRKNYLDGNPSGVEADDLFAMSAAGRKYQNQLSARGLSLTTPEAATPVQFLPKYAKVVYEQSKDIAALNENVLDGIAHYAAMEKIYVESAQRAAAKVLGGWAEQLPALKKNKLVTATRDDPSAGLFSNDSSAYGTVGSSMSFIGSIVRAIKQDFRKNLNDTLAPAMTRMAGKTEAVFEFEGLNQKITRTGKQFYLREAEDGTQVLIDKKLVKRNKAGEEEINWEAAEDGVNAFNIRNVETAEFIRAHIAASGLRTQNFREIRAAQGKVDNKDPEVFRPIRPDLKQYAHFAFVKDPRVTGTGHMTMIHAASEKELAQLAERVPPQYKVIYKRDTEDYFKARDEYDYQRTLNENYLDSELANNGVFSNFFPKSDPQKIADDILQQHYRESDTLVYESVRLNYEPQFALLEDLGRQYSLVETSKFASRADMIEAQSKNPYFNQIKTALDISKINEHPLVYGANKLLDTAVSKAWASITRTFDEIKSPGELDRINALTAEYGIQPAYYDAAMQALVNHTAPRGALTRFVRGANAILSRFTLGLDPLNALNNVIGSNVLRGTEMGLLTRAIREGNQAVAGDLSALAKIKLPGVDAEVLSPTKLLAQAITNFWKDAKQPVVVRMTDAGPVYKLDAKGNTVLSDYGPLMAKYRDMQIIKDRAEQLKMLVDDFTLKGTESAAELDTRMARGFARAKELTSEKLDTAEKLTGNTFAEEFNRFISANVMDQITSIAVKHGLMDDATARTYINTFVNRVEGNIVASQRPLIFQGPIGQAISLFQSYQFNLIQQLLRFTAEGKAKDLAMLAGLQSTLYGYQSLPGFQAINVHIIGQLGGNDAHKDLYDITYGAVGRTAGDFILYGIPSTLLDTNIYSRGDVNPRHLTILPTSLQETPIVAGWGKFFGSIYETSKRIAGGGDVWETFLQGVEHNGINRPLAGLAQTVQAFGPEGMAYSTSNKGTILYQNDLMSLATLTRLAGGRPMDEAIVNDAMFRVRTYEARRREKLLSLGEKVKGTLIQGNQPTDEQINQFAEEYAKLGGKQKQFNKWMMEMYKNANTAQAEKLAESLNNPYSYKIQLLMGGGE